ncbi:MAG: tRNA uridine-5-carboxymethylaminomethyl(34) synthesis enzyme MnmG [Magnetococcales bacterium]|nr:tRNA uridine-5-carboxymethylaminomethyl(34) synthesis enzyme MnmG [Magnetococcales bacterium]
MAEWFDVIVIGAGHAGCEAAHAAARLGASTLLLTQNLDTIGQMSCNPAIGGVGKGHLVREVDALGGLMGRVADAAGIQFRLLNRRKGPAVRGPRAQMDKQLYRRCMRQALEETPNLVLRQAEVRDLLVEGNAVCGVVTDWGESCFCRSVVLTTGTFLRGVAHLGERQFPAGRLGDAPSQLLGEGLARLELTTARMKTGTPPRLDGRSIRWDLLEEQPGDDPPAPFSFLTGRLMLEQVSCYITYTNSRSHELIRANLHRAPLYTGQIQSIGPRYCPSIEDKVVRFADRERHQIFLEPEGRHVREVYPNGISTSLPVDVQRELLHSIRGLESVRILRPGYAIEYDMADPRHLDNGLQSKKWPGVFLAGQINGTTGYEEAAAQGLVAGINGALFAAEKPLFRPGRDQCYIGVMIDDLVTRGVDEPYRMFTSRAEFRLLLRADNADARLTPIGRELGLVSEERWMRFVRKQELLVKGGEVLHSVRLPLREVLLERDESVVGYQTGWELLRRQDVDVERVWQLSGLAGEEEDVLAGLEVDAVYHGYREKQQEEVRRFRETEDWVIPEGFDWDGVGSLSVEIRQKCKRVRPQTLGQAYRIPGVTPAAVMAVWVALKRGL